MRVDPREYDVRLVAHVKRLHLDLLTRQRSARAEAKAAVAIQAFNAAHPILLQDMRDLARKNETLAKLLQILEKKGSFTPRQQKLATDTVDIIREEAQFKPRNKIYGHDIAVGEAFDVTARVIAQIETQYGYMSVLNTADGMQIKTFDIPLLPRRSRIRLIGFVKAHARYQSDLQLVAKITGHEVLHGPDAEQDAAEREAAELARNARAALGEKELSTYMPA